jgi:hypothetical protein
MVVGFSAPHLLQRLARGATLPSQGVPSTGVSTEADTVKKNMVLKLEKGLNFCLSKIDAGGTLCLRKDCLIGNHLSGETFVVDEHRSIWSKRTLTLVSANQRLMLASSVMKYGTTGKIPVCP